MATIGDDDDYDDSESTSIEHQLFGSRSDDLSDEDYSDQDHGIISINEGDGQHRNLEPFEAWPSVTNYRRPFDDDTRAKTNDKDRTVDKTNQQAGNEAFSQIVDGIEQDQQENITNKGLNQIDKQTTNHLPFILNSSGSANGNGKGNSGSRKSISDDGQDRPRQMAILVRGDGSSSLIPPAISVDNSLWFKLGGHVSGSQLSSQSLPNSLSAPYRVLDLMTSPEMSSSNPRIGWISTNFISDSDKSDTTTTIVGGHDGHKVNYGHRKSNRLTNNAMDSLLATGSSYPFPSINSFPEYIILPERISWPVSSSSSTMKKTSRKRGKTNNRNRSKQRPTFDPGWQYIGLG